MNFFAHATLAAQRSSHPRFLLGAMLPDLVGMLGIRIVRIDDPELAAGVAHHHETDAAFHAAPLFSELCGDAIAQLTSQGVARGTARAVGHVGIELLLDGLLSHDAAACTRYAQALHAMSEAALRQSLLLRHEDDVAQLSHGVLRLSTAPVPHGYRDPDFVVARLEHILARRPRLSMQASDRACVSQWAHGASRTLASCHLELLDQVRRASLQAPSGSA